MTQLNTIRVLEEMHQAAAAKLASFRYLDELQYDRNEAMKAQGAYDALTALSLVAHEEFKYVLLNKLGKPIFGPADHTDCVEMVDGDCDTIVPA